MTKLAPSHRAKEGGIPLRTHGAASGPAATSVPTSGTASPLVPAVFPVLPQPPQREGFQPAGANDGEAPESPSLKAEPRRATRVVAATALAMVKDADPPASSKAAELGTPVLAHAGTGEPGVQASAATPSAPPVANTPSGAPSNQPAHTGPTAPPAAAPSASPPHLPVRSPAFQVAPVMVSLASNGAGTHRLVLRLDPPELGRLEVRMTRNQDAGTRIEVTVEKPATLALLRQDEPALHRALSDAGVPPEGRSVSMQLGQPGGQELAGQGGQGKTPRRPSGAASGMETGLDVAEVPPSRLPHALRSALDITA